MDDEVFVIGDPEPEETEQPPPRKWWLILVAVGLIAAVTVATRPEPDSEAEATTPTLPASATQVEAPRPATVVDRTLEWRKADGFEELVSLGGVVDFDGAWWAVGSDDDGLAAWSNQSDDPAGPWELASRFDDAHAPLEVRSVAVVGDELAAIASARFATRLIASPDGYLWTERELPGNEDNGGETLPIQVIATDTGSIVYAAERFPPTREAIIPALPEEFAHLVADEIAGIGAVRSTVTVWVAPGIEIARFSTDELGVDPLPAGNDSFLVAWHGPDLERLEPERVTGISPYQVQSSDSGRIFARMGGRLGTSSDGLEWELSLTGEVESGPVEAFVPWKDGVVIFGPRDDDPTFWSPSTDERQDFPIPDLERAEVAFAAPVAGDAGMAVVAHAARNEMEPSSTLVAEEGRRQLFYLSNDHVQYVEDGIEVGRRPAYQEGIGYDVEQRQLVFDNDGTEFIRVPVELWVDTVEQSFRQVGLGEDLRLLHTRDGSEWSVEEWDEITGLDAPGLGGLFAAGDFLVAVATGDDGTSEGVWVARPLE